MNPMRIGVLASAARRDHGAVVKALLLGGALAIGALTAGPAEANSILITTTGTIVSGSDPSDLFGAGPDLAGDSYTLVAEYDALGPSYFTDGSGNVGLDIGDPITGYVTATVNGVSLTTAIVDFSTATLVEDRSNLFASNSGNDAAGDFVFVSQEVDSTANFIPYADLQTPFDYVLASGDFSLDNYSFTNAADTVTVSFAGTPVRVNFQVPEPASWALMGVGLLGLGLSVRRRRA